MRHLQSFRYIKAIVEAGSIRGAAENLAISPSALNRHIQALELDLDFRIFERLSRGVSLSPEGEVFYAFALNQLSGFNRVRNQIDTFRGLSIGTVRLGISEDVYSESLYQIISDFQRNNNRVDIEILTVVNATLADLLRGGGLDLAVFANPVLKRGITALHIKDSQLSAFVPNGIGLGKSGMLKIHELQNMRVALSPAETETTKRIIAAAERLRIDFQRHYAGPDVLRYLEYTHMPVIGCLMIAEADETTIRVPGYKRLPLDGREVGACNISVLASDERGLSVPAYKLQEAMSVMFQ